MGQWCLLSLWYQHKLQKKKKKNAKTYKGNINCERRGYYWFKSAYVQCCVWYNISSGIQHLVLIWSECGIVRVLIRGDHNLFTVSSRFSSSPPASQLLMSAIVGPDEPFSHSSAIASWRSEVKTVPSFSDSSGHVTSLLPEDNGYEGHVCQNWTSSAHIKPTAVWKVLYRNV
jgi:hypothetical protein